MLIFFLILKFIRIFTLFQVRNLSFHKEVHVKYTSNSWASTNVTQATYIPAPNTAVAYDLYDRFAFEMPLPDAERTDKLEFCVQFTCDGTDYWDNNNGRNYILISFRTKDVQNSSSASRDPYRLNLDSWSEFAAWNYANTEESPYW